MRPAQRGAPTAAIGRSRGGLTTKLHVAVDAIGLPLRIHSTPGHHDDCPQPRPSRPACGASATSLPMPPTMLIRYAPSSPMTSARPPRSRPIPGAPCSSKRLEALQRTPSGRVLLQQAQTLLPYNPARRENSSGLHGLSAFCMNHDLVTINAGSDPYLPAIR